MCAALTSWKRRNEVIKSPFSVRCNMTQPVLGNRGMRSDKPSVRIRNAMKRISRNQWLHPKRVRQISFSLARKCCSNPFAAINAAFNQDCLHVGMIEGEPTFSRILEPDQYLQMLMFCKEKNSIKQMLMAEFFILKLTLQKERNHGTRD